MPLIFEEIHAATNPKNVNEEFYILANTGAAAISTAGMHVIISRPGKRGSVMGQIDPGFTLQPGEKILVVCGIPGKVSQGNPPTREGLRTYFLFQREGLLKGTGTTLRFSLNQMDMARATHDSKAPNGIAEAK